MSTRSRYRLAPSRRGFLAAAAGLAAVPAWAEDGGPRSTDGDDRREPDWEERLTLTVGPASGDLSGRDEKVIQAALDAVARRGGGTVRLLPGTFVCRNAIVLPSAVRLAGSGSETILTKIPSETVPLAEDADWYDQEITLADAAGFRVGDGVLLRATNPHDGGPTVIKRTLVARLGRRFKLDAGLRENLWVSGTPVCASLFPILTADHAADVVVEHLTIDGNRAANDTLDGNYGGCVFLQDCRRMTLRGIVAHDYNGDGISFQICHDVLVEDCHSHDHTGLGLHPGSGSQRPVMRRNLLERNDIGLFWCWGVKHGLAEDNRMLDNRAAGISIGHNDTDNLMRRNVVRGSGQVGVLFRDESRGRDFWPNRNRLEANEILDSGGDDGVAIDIRGRTRDIDLVGNRITESRAAADRIGIRIGPDAGRVSLDENAFAGLAVDIRDERPSPG